MHRRDALTLLSMAIVSGCGPSFDSEREELEYLSDLSNPTPTQWKRRQMLEKKITEENEASYERAGENIDKALDKKQAE